MRRRLRLPDRRRLRTAVVTLAALFVAASVSGAVHAAAPGASPGPTSALGPAFASVPAGAAAAPASAASPASASPAPLAPPGPAGARSLGDPFYPTLGNGGYDTTTIDLDVTWATPDARHPEGLATVRTVLDLRTTQELGELSLDLAPASTTVSAVRVDGVPAAWQQDAVDRKLVVTLPAAVPSGTTLEVAVDSTAVPGPVPRTGEDGTFDRPGQTVDETRIREGRGLIADGAGGMLLAAQPDGAHTLFPVNDHPLDKATVRVTLTAPPGMLGVATGALVAMHTAADGSVTTTWASDRPVASHVLALGVGDLVLRTGPAVDGVTYRSAVPTDLAPIADGLLGELPGFVAWLEDAIGAPYPFDTFGLLAYAGRPTTAILEGQTLVLITGTVFSPLVDACKARGTIVHEAAHQWFGDLASIARWDEKWLSEGHATYYEWRWLAEHGCLPAPSSPTDPAASPPPGAVATPGPDGTLPPADAAAALDARMRVAYEAAAAVRATDGPPSAPVDPAAAYTPAIYDQGALALYALRLEVGDRRFGRIERAFLKRAADGTATTDDLIRIASRVARRDLGPFLDAWLRGPVVPPMPGRPGWTTGDGAPPSDGGAAASPSPVPAASAPSVSRSSAPAAWRSGPAAADAGGSPSPAVPTPPG